MTDEIAGRRVLPKSYSASILGNAPKCTRCGIDVKATPFAIEGKTRCVGRACLVCCAKFHKHPIGS